MREIENSCNNRGCEYIRILPSCVRPESLITRDLQKRNDFAKILSLANLQVDKQPSKKAA